jgi:hypothetical protein
MTTYSDERGSHADRLSRLDQLEREIAEERARLNSADTDPTTDRYADRDAAQVADRTTDQYAAHAADRTNDQYADRGADRTTDQYAARAADRTTDRNAAHAADRTNDQYADRGADRGARAEDASGRPSSVRTVDLPELEERVTESQREAWALGYQAGIADSQTRTGTPTQNPFHPLRGR